MKVRKIAFAIAACTATLLPTMAKADTVDARCDVYPRGEDYATAVTACTFSQRQGAVGIQLADGTRYDLRPVGDDPGNYVDQNGRAAYRQSDLGNLGQIYRLNDVSIYVYWNTAGIPGSTRPSVRPSTPVANRPSGQGGYVTLTARDSGARINLRREATIDSGLEGYGIPGDRVQLLQCVQDYDRYNSDLNWCQVRFPRSRAVGWVRSDFIIFEDAGE